MTAADSVDMDFPYHFDVVGRTALADEAEHVEDMIEQFLFTAAGERVMLPEFGSGLLQRVFQPNAPEVAAALQLTTHAGLQRWLGDMIEIRDLTATSDEATLTVRVVYLIRRTREERTRVFERGLT
jgi:phage baseplate assembly protein W